MSSSSIPSSSSANQPNATGSPAVPNQLKQYADINSPGTADSFNNVPFSGMGGGLKVAEKISFWKNPFQWLSNLFHPSTAKTAVEASGGLSTGAMVGIGVGGVATIGAAIAGHKLGWFSSGWKWMKEKLPSGWFSKAEDTTGAGAANPAQGAPQKTAAELEAEQKAREAEQKAREAEQKASEIARKKSEIEAKFGGTDPAERLKALEDAKNTDPELAKNLLNKLHTSGYQNADTTLQVRALEYATELDKDLGRKMATYFIDNNAPPIVMENALNQMEKLAFDPNDSKELFTKAFNNQEAPIRLLALKKANSSAASLLLSNPQMSGAIQGAQQQLLLKAFDDTDQAIVLEALQHADKVSAENLNGSMLGLFRGNNPAIQTAILQQSHLMKNADQTVSPDQIFLLKEAVNQRNPHPGVLIEAMNQSARLSPEDGKNIALKAFTVGNDEVRYDAICRLDPSQLTNLEKSTIATQFQPAVKQPKPAKVSEQKTPVLNGNENPSTEAIEQGLKNAEQKSQAIEFITRLEPEKRDAALQDILNDESNVSLQFQALRQLESLPDADRGRFIAQRREKLAEQALLGSDFELATQAMGEIKQLDPDKQAALLLKSYEAHLPKGTSSFAKSNAIRSQLIEISGDLPKAQRNELLKKAVQDESAAVRANAMDIITSPSKERLADADIQALLKDSLNKPIARHFDNWPDSADNILIDGFQHSSNNFTRKLALEAAMNSGRPELQAKAWQALKDENNIFLPGNEAIFDNAKKLLLEKRNLQMQTQMLNPNLPAYQQAWANQELLKPFLGDAIVSRRNQTFADSLGNFPDDVINHSIQHVDDDVRLKALEAALKPERSPKLQGKAWATLSDDKVKTKASGFRLRIEQLRDERDKVMTAALMDSNSSLHETAWKQVDNLHQSNRDSLVDDVEKLAQLPEATQAMFPDDLKKAVSEHLAKKTQ